MTREHEGCSAKAIILAAGRGNRLGPLGEGRPKCMAVVLGGKTLLEMGLETLRSCGIRDISVVRGYRAEQIRYPGVTYFLNREYDDSNILGSLACAEEKLYGETIVSYADIWYEASVVRQLLACEHDLALTVNTTWRDHYAGRTDHPVEEAEQVIFNRKNEVTRIGKLAAVTEEPVAEFIGLMKLSGRGCELFRRHYHRARSQYEGRPFQRARRFEHAYLTDLLQEMVDCGIAIHCERITGGWGEIDTMEDYARALTVFNADRKAGERADSKEGT